MSRTVYDVPLPTLFDYRVPRLNEADIGYRVRVPFGRKTLVVAQANLERDIE